LDAAEPDIAQSFADRLLVEGSIRYTVGGTYSFLGEHEKAITNLDRALVIFGDKLGSNDLRTLSVMTTLAGAYDEAGRVRDSIRLSKEALESYRDKLPEAHPYTLGAMWSLAAAYRAAAGSIIACRTRWRFQV
jgi:tetratricopeptide (TPR) repeat protein